MSGVSYSPALEWRLAAKAFHYTWEQFVALEGPQQAEIVAAFRIERHMEAVTALEMSRATARSSRTT